MHVHLVNDFCGERESIRFLLGTLHTIMMIEDNFAAKYGQNKEIRSIARMLGSVHSTALNSLQQHLPFQP